MRTETALKPVVVIWKSRPLLAALSAAAGLVFAFWHWPPEARLARDARDWVIPMSQPLRAAVDNVIRSQGWLGGLQDVTVDCGDRACTTDVLFSYESPKGRTELRVGVRLRPEISPVANRGVGPPLLRWQPEESTWSVTTFAPHSFAPVSSASGKVSDLHALSKFEQGSALQTLASRLTDQFLQRVQEHNNAARIFPVN